MVGNSLFTCSVLVLKDVDLKQVSSDLKIATLKSIFRKCARVQKVLVIFMPVVITVLIYSYVAGDQHVLIGDPLFAGDNVLALRDASEMIYLPGTVINVDSDFIDVEFCDGTR